MFKKKGETLFLFVTVIDFLIKINFLKKISYGILWYYHFNT